MLAAGALLRVAWVSYAGVEPRYVSDPSAYLLQGEQIAHGFGYTNPLVRVSNVSRAAHHQPLVPEQASSFYPPGYPTFVAGVAWVVWHTPIPDGDGAIVRTVGFVQVLLGLAGILLLYEIARRLLSERIALVAAAMMALYPGLITLTATLQLETVFITLSLATFLAVLPLATAPGALSRRRLLLAGALIGAVSLVRPTVALLIVAFAVARLVARRPWRETAAALALLVAATIAIVVPWTIRNAVALHAFVPLSTGIGPALCMARNPQATGYLDSRILVAECSPPPGHRLPAADDVAANRFATSEAIHWVLHHPVGEARMWFWRTFYAYRHDTTGVDDFGARMSTRWHDVVVALSDSAAFVVLAFAAVGGVTLAITRRRGAVFLAASTVLFAAVPLMLFGDPRYRVPAEPLFMILAAIALCAAVDGIRQEAGQPGEGDGVRVGGAHPAADELVDARPPWRG